MRTLLRNFRNFAFSGSLVDLAVGLAIGVAFATVVESLVGDVILPLVAAIFGEPNFDALVLTVNGAEIRYGSFLTALVSFLLLALTIMFLVQAIRRATGRETAGAQGNRECDHCKSFIPVDRLGLHVLHPGRRSDRPLTPPSVRGELLGPGEDSGAVPLPGLLGGRKGLGGELPFTLGRLGSVVGLRERRGGRAIRGLAAVQHAPDVGRLPMAARQGVGRRPHVDAGQCVAHRPRPQQRRSSNAAAGGGVDGRAPAPPTRRCITLVSR